MESVTCEQLREVCNIVICAHVLETNGVGLDAFANEMVADINVLRARMLYIVLRERNCGLVVCIELSRALLCEREVCE